MGFFNYIHSGPRESFEPFRRDHYEVDTPPQVISDTVTDFSGTITSVQDDGERKSVVIDRIVQIERISDQIFKSAKETWSRLALFGTITSVITIVAGAASLAGAIALGILLPPLLLVALAVGLVACAAIGFGAFTSYRTHQARGELALWKDPIEKAIEERRAARQGFFHVQKQDLKGKVVSQQETTKLWKEAIQVSKERFRSLEQENPQAQGKAVEEFFKADLLDSSAVRYAFPHNPPNIQDYYALHTRYCGISIESSQRALGVYQGATHALNHLSHSHAMTSAQIHGTSALLHTLPRTRHGHTAISAVSAGAQVANSFAHLGAIAENSYHTDQQISKINQDKYLMYSALLQPIKAMLDKISA